MKKNKKEMGRDEWRYFPIVSGHVEEESKTKTHIPNAIMGSDDGQ